MQGEASILSSVSKSAMQSYTAGLEKSQAEGSHFASSADLYEKYFFSLIAEANRSKKVSPAIRLLEYAFIYIQLLLSAYNDFIPYGHVEEHYLTFLKFFYIGFIGTADDVLPFIIGLCIVDVITIGFFGVTILDFQLNHEYRKWILYILRIWHGHLFGILLIPNFLMLMKGIAYLGLHNEPVGYVVVILTSICGFVSVWHYLVLLPFFSRTPYLSPSPIHAWDIKRIYKYLLISAIPMGLETFLNDQFEEWIEIIPLFLMIGIFIYLIYELCSLPFKGVLFNALLFGCFNGVILGAAFSIAEAISEGVSDMIFYSGPVILCIITSIVTYFIIRNYRKKVAKSLSYKSFNEPGVRPTEDMKKEHLETLNIKNKKKAFMFVQIGFEEMCDMFVDWSLCKFVFEKYPAEDNLVVFISWLVSLFPSEIQFLHRLITEGGKIVEISLDNRFLFFQIHRIHIFRQSSTSRETSNDFNKVKRITDQTISAFCKYWLDLAKPNHEFKPSIYQGLAHQKQQAEAAWSEALDKYPNNPRFANEHAIFLLEVGCHFKESIRENQSAQQLENGFHMHNDRTFRYFVLSYPCYLKKGVVDVRGNLKGPQIEKINSNPSLTQNSFSAAKTSTTTKTSSSSLVNSETSNGSSSDQIDMQEGARFLPQMNLRLALQRAIKEMKAGTIGKIMVSALLRAILTIVFILIVILIARPMFDSRKYLFDIFYKIDKMQHSLSLLSIQVPFFIHENLFDGDPELFRVFLDEVSSLWDSSQDDPSDTQPKYEKIFEQFESQVDILHMNKRQILCHLALQLLNDMNDFNNEFYKVDHSTDGRLEALNIILYEIQFSTYACGIPKGSDQATPALRENTISLDYLIRTFALQLRVMTLNSNEEVKFWGKNSTDFCELYTNQNYIFNVLKLIPIQLSQPLQYLYRDEIGQIIPMSTQSLRSQRLNEIKSKRKEKIIQNFMQSISRNSSSTNQANISINKLREFVDNPSFDRFLTNDINNDLKTFNLHKRIIRKVRKNLNSTVNNKIKETINSVNSTQNQNIKHKVFTLSDEDSNNEDIEEEIKEVEEEEEEELEEDNNIESICSFIIAFSPFLLCLFILPSVVYLSDGLEDEIKTYSSVLQHVPKADCLKAGERIKPIEYNDDQNKNKKKHNKKKHESHLVADAGNSTKTHFWVFDVVSAAIIIVFLIVFSVVAQSTKNKIEDCLQYYSLIMAQRNLLFSIDKDLSYSLLYIQCATRPDLQPTRFGLVPHLNASTAFYKAIVDITKLSVISQIIDTGSEEFDVGSTILADKKINQIRFDPICSDKIESEIIIDYYKCTSLVRIISYYVELINSCIQIYMGTGVPFQLIQSPTPYLIHMLDTRIAVGFSQIADRFREIFDESIKSFNTLLIVIPIVSVIFTLVTYVLEMLLLMSVSNQFEVFKSLMLRINPISFVANNQLISLVYGKNDKASQIVSASHAVFTTSPDAMISLNNEGVIEYLNPAATSIFGYTPEQMLGQNVKMILNVESKETTQLFYQMQLMQSGQTSLIYECEVKGTRDDGSIIYLNVTLIGFTASTGQKVADNFALTCRDMTNEIMQKNAVEEAKKQSEQLLLQILPKDIIMRLNRGDTDISFTVQSSTIAFIDIEKFSNYSASLSASEIMQNLGLVFTAYDRLLAKYSLIIKIKLIGDDYMLAAGLFNQDVEPPKHATQVVNFTLECLDAIEELNEQLNALLQVRIGVNSGGPLIAGVLGTDKPLFDIIGDPINVASRLQSTDIPGFVQISQQTYNYVVDNEEFHIEQRGEVELKGKGKQMTYLVHPHQRENDKDRIENSQSSMEFHDLDDDIPK